MFITIYHIAGMDCPSEESMIKMQLTGLDSVIKLEFDLNKRELIVIHTIADPEIENRLRSLNLGAQLIDIKQTDDEQHLMLEIDDQKRQSRILWLVLAINLAFFFIEIVAGFFAGSMGLLADSLDMLADALVYGLSLWAIGTINQRKKKVATLSGYLQLALAFIGFLEVVRRFIGIEEIPDFQTMIIISFLALLANSFCLYLLQKQKSEEVHMKASMIFTSNDVIINAGVIIAGVLVLLTQSIYPDLIIGSIVFFVVVKGALRILKLGI